MNESGCNWNERNEDELFVYNWTSERREEEVIVSHWGLPTMYLENGDFCFSDLAEL